MRELIDRIEIANSDELSKLVGAVIRRYRVLHPEWEVVFYSLHRFGEKRESDISALIYMLK